MENRVKNIIMDKKQVIQEIVKILEPSFNKHGFENKRLKFFEKKEGENVFLYEIDLSKSKGYFSLHLRLHFLNKKISNLYNSVMKKVLTDEQTTFPSSWSKKDIENNIKGRSSVKRVSMLTDWRKLKEEDESLEDFYSKFSIWFCVFDKLDEKEGYKEQLLLSIDLALKWFEKIKTEEYLVENTHLQALCVLKMKNKKEELQLKFNSIIDTLEKQKRDKEHIKEIKLFFKYLNEVNLTETT